MAVSDFLMVVPNASRVAFPYELPSISTDLEAVTVVSGICFVAHEAEKCHINWCHTQLKGFKMKTEILAKAVEDLTKGEIRAENRSSCKLKVILNIVSYDSLV